MFEAPNLDSMTAEELASFIDGARLAIKYATSKRAAVLWRLEGKVNLANSEEDNCERIYVEMQRIGVDVW
jgi:hypothetical protein